MLSCVKYSINGQRGHCGNSMKQTLDGFMYEVACHCPEEEAADDDEPFVESGCEDPPARHQRQRYNPVPYVVR